MKNIQRYLYLLFAWLVVQQGLAQQGQTNIACKNLSSEVFYTGEVFFSNGSSSNAFNATRRMNTTIGQAVIGESFNQDFNSGLGFWSNLLLAPSAPTVICSEGDLPDRINVTWETDPLSPAASGGFNIYRDGVLLSTEDSDVRSFVDFNVIAGQFYTYSVAGKSQFGEGYKGSSLGFLSPNGVVTGEVRTLSQNPVQDVLVTLTPTIGAALDFHGDDKVFAEYNPVLDATNWSVSCWVKLYNNNDNAGILDFGSAINKNFWIHTTASAAGKGIVAGVGTGSGSETMQYIFPVASKDDWHYITMTSNGMSVLLYVDGEFVTTKMVTCDRDSSQIYFGSKTGDTGYYKGKLDEVRFYSRQLSQTDLQMGMNRTVNSDANGLLAYWKFDEGVGSKSFDLSKNKIKAYLCGASWTTDKPEVQNAGMSNAQGIFKIEGINYGPGTTFTASAAKNFYFNQSLEFNASNEQFADLTSFDLQDTSTVTFTVKPFDLGGSMTVLSKQGTGGNDQFIASIDAGTLKIKIGDTENSYGTLSAGFHHVAVTMLQNGASATAKVFVDGTQVGSEETFTGVDTDFNNGTPWTLGTKLLSGQNSLFLTGLVDEAAFFTENLSLPQIQTYANIGTDLANANLKNYFNLNEGVGDSLQDLGTALSGMGVRRGASWSVSAAIEKTLPHIFTPNSRLVTLTPSNTSTDGVQFTDQSLVPVSGYVRYDGTNCFVEGAEILGDGAHFGPPVFTDKDGKFICELEPGATVKLSAKYKNHTILLPFWEIRNIASPVAGILFRDITKREISGQLAGGLCRKSIIPDQAIVKVKVASEDGCFEKIIQLTHADNEDGKFKFTNLPPKAMTISVIEHSNSVIYNYFQLQGGAALDLTDTNKLKDFIYFAPPQVELSPLDTNSCGDPMLTQSEKYTVEIKVYQDYDGGRCYLQNADISIYNQISDKPQFDTTMTGGKLKYKFTAGLPQLPPPYLKSLTVSATANDQSADNTLEAVVLGKRAREVNFTSTSPEIPILILRDPPGDESFSFLEKSTELCLGIQFGVKATTGQKSEFETKVGIDTEIATGIGVEKTTKIEATNTQAFSVEATQSAELSTSLETCLTLNERMQTNSAELITDEDADLYVGAAMNLLYGITDDLIWVKDSCKFKVVTGLMVMPDKFATTFIYSQYQIEHVVIPSLELVGDTTSANLWRKIVERDSILKKDAIFLANYSFDAGVNYEQSASTSISGSVEFNYEFEITASVANELGVEVDGNGVSGKLEQSLTLGFNAGASLSASYERTTGFSLGDNEIGDYFTVDVLLDKTYGTPVFKTLSGASSCPWEPNTVPRDEVALSVDHQVVNNVPANGAAEFKFNLGNISQTEELRNYFFFLGAESNPLGAIVKANGSNMASPLGYQIPYDAPIEVTVTVERGPGGDFDYEDLEIALYVGCHDERFTALGLGPETDPRFYKAIFVDAHFLEPCSNVDIGFPLQDWVLTPADGDALFVTLNNYDISDPDLDVVRVQYRRTQGDGSWINVIEIPKADLGTVSEIVPWDTDGLADGLYEIRAVAACVGGLEEGISKIIKGKIERTSPEIFGTPQPADGVLAAGDEISIQFTEPIRCDLLIQADIFNNNNVGLYDTETGDLVDAIITCQGDKIIIVPNVPNRFIENKVLRVEVDNIQDLADNPFIHKSWEFVVNRNPVHWEGGKVKVAKKKADLVTVTRRIVNDGGQATAFLIEGVPNWVRVYPLSGLLLPGSSEEITFEFNNDLAYGNYLDTISINPPEGYEPLIVDCRVLCESPEWDYDAAAYSQTMNFTLKLDIEGEISTDEQDIVAAFIDGEVRGTAKILALPSLNQYMAFLTVYGDEDDFDKPVKLEIWDASACLRYGEVIEQFTFQVDNIIGTVGNPQVIHTNSMVRRDIPLGSGWNWISFNLAHPDPALNPALASLQHPQNDLIKGQSSFAEYFGSDWIGSLTALNNTNMFQFRADVPDTIQMVGALIDPAALSIPVSTGWNWIGYIPNYSLSVTEALVGLTPLNGDVIKGQTSFAQYLAGFGWIGSLQFMEPPYGYLLKISNPGSLTYPANTFARGASDDRGKPTPPVTFWNVDPSAFEYSMTLVGMLSVNGQNATLAQHELGVFAGNELRGSATAIYVAPLDAYMFFLTAYANTSGEPLQFKLYNSATGQVGSLSEQMYFSSNLHQGSVETPVPFTLGSTGLTELAASNFFDVQPNPFTNALTIRFECMQEQEVQLVITDATGRMVYQQNTMAGAGMNTIQWNAQEGSAGLYFVRLETIDGMAIKKVTRM